ncbi:MAG: alpha/beta hydrolase [Proteobacteria bacterium]|nr:alpha/beta hydrolase [Pseudomonadota bacterium]
MKSFTKQILKHPEFYIIRFIKDKNLPDIIFIHGGPGFNCGILEYLIEHHNLYDSINANIILYDQRNCGKSKKNNTEVKHQDNINDLNLILNFIYKYKIHIKALIGHSYGAKLLFDFYNFYKLKTPGVFVSTAKSIITPRLNNLLHDLSYIKKANSNLYNEIYESIDKMDLPSLWEITEKLNTIFQENENRPFLYWANLTYYNLVKNIQKEINLPPDLSTFKSVRQDLYSNYSNFSVDLDELNIPKLWINGFHDVINNGHLSALTMDDSIKTFYKSSHYPHIEENFYFCQCINEFIEQL